MIHLFNRRGRILFFPVKWANAVASWILGLHSPTGTLRISNTANPTESGGATVDVDMEVVTAKAKERLTGHFQTKREVEASIERAADGSSIVARDRRLHVNDDWIRGVIGDVSGAVKTVDNVAPDSSGNVTLNAVTEDDLDGYATQNWVTSELASYATDSELDTVSQSVSDLTDVVQTINDDYVTSDDLAQYAKTSDIESTYETKADATAISDRVDTIEGEYVTEDDLGDYVTTDTAQTITGMKTFDNSIKASTNLVLIRTNDTSYTLLCGGSNWNTGGHIVLSGASNTDSNGYGIVSLRGYCNGKTAYFSMIPTDSSGSNPCASFSFNGNSAFKITAGSKYMQSNLSGNSKWQSLYFTNADGTITGSVISGIDSLGNNDAYLRAYNNGTTYFSSIRVSISSTGVASASFNYTGSAPEDTTSTTDNQIAWRGWVNDKFLRKATASTTYAAISHKHGNITSTGKLIVNDTVAAAKVLVTSSDGWISYSSGLVASDLWALKDCITAYSPSSNTGYVSALSIKSNSTTEGVGIIAASRAVTFGTSTAQCSIASSNAGLLTVSGVTGITLNADADDAKLANAPTATTEDTSSNAIATCGWVASNFAAADEENPTEELTVVTNVEWTGTVLRRKIRKLTITKGIITSIGTASWVNFETPTVITWA